MNTDKSIAPHSHSAVWALMAFFSGIGYIALLIYIENELIAPLVLPENPCYYHTHEVPYWIDFFYMSAGNNGHPSTSFKLLFLILILGFFLGHFTIKRIRLMRSPSA